MQTHLPALNSLKFFDAAARAGSFKKASEELNVTPTAISHQIKALEATLGTLLFIRKTRAIKLTREGKLLAETTHNVLQQLTNTISEISNIKNVITVSTTSSFAAMWLVPNLGSFNRLYPNIEIVIKTSEQVDNMEKDRRVDLAIRYGIYNKILQNSFQLVTEKIGMYATPRYIKDIALGRPVNLLETKWQNTNLPEFTWEALRKHSLDKTNTVTVRQFTQEHHIIQAALAGQGIALVSSLLVEHALEQSWLVKCDYIKDYQEINGLSYYLLIPEHNIHSNNIIKFKNWLAKELED